MTLRLLLIRGCALTCVLAATAGSVPLRAADEPLVAPRLVGIRVESLTVERIDFGLMVSVRPSRNLTVRRVTFTDGTIEGVPIHVEPIDADWKLTSELLTTPT